MTAGWTYVALWGVLLAVLAVLHLAFEVEEIQIALAGGAAVAILALGGLLVARPPHDGVRLLPETSYATVVVAIGIAMVALGLIFGMWLWLMGVGVVVLGSAGLAREALAARRSAG